MAGMVVQHNLNSINANNKMNINVSGTRKATEKLSSGFQINRAGDNAAGLAISEKMRSQIRGLGQATSNASDGISLIQTAEGGLNETHAILQRMRELSVQSANGTYKQEDRDAIQVEVDNLKSEVNRISASTEYNGIKLLDGSLGGISSGSSDYGPRYGLLLSGEGNALAGTSITSSIEGVSIALTADGTSGAGGENASWDETGKVLTINLTAGQKYTQGQIDDLIKTADTQKTTAQGSAIPNVGLNLANGVFTMTTDLAVDLGATVAGARAASGDGTTANLTDILVGATATEGYADTITITSNSYGEDTRQFNLKFDVADGKENVAVVAGGEENDPNVKNGGFDIHLVTGKDYTEADIESIMAKAGLDYSIGLKDSTSPDGDVKLKANVKADLAFDMSTVAGTGLRKDAIGGSGDGLTFQIGANGVEDQRVTLNINKMDAGAIGIADVKVSDQDSANSGISKVDKAIERVSTQRASLGALQNRLEYTVNNLTTTNENLTAAESQIRDTDMATEMINYTKFNILQQASQAMLAQANQAPQAVLQLLG